MRLTRSNCIGRKAMINLDSKLKKQRHYFDNSGLSSQSYGFSNSHVWMWELDYKESWALKNWCLWTVVLEKTLESPLDSKDIKQVNPKENHSWIFIGRTDTEVEDTILMQRSTWCKELIHFKKTLMLGEIEGGRRRRLQWMRWLDGITESMDMSWTHSWK